MPVPAAAPVPDVAPDGVVTLDQLADVVAAARAAGIPGDTPVHAQVFGTEGRLNEAGLVRQVTVEAPAVPLSEAVKATTIVVHDTPETPEAAIARGLADMEARRLAAQPRRPGPTRW